VDKVDISVLQRGDVASLRNKMVPSIDKMRGPNVSYSNVKPGGTYSKQFALRGLSVIF
jgi:hypothetical protein